MSLSFSSHVRCLISCAGFALLSLGAQAQTTFINEFHYDNDGVDSNERVEVIAPAGSNLSGWRVVLYNGGDGRAYSTLTLSGTTANQCGGYGTVTVTAPTATGIQNGSPDGLALINAAGSVVQFLSYEGSFRALDGAANGLNGTDIGVAETSTTPVGQSLQLAGTGSSAGQFTWQPARASSWGVCNVGQSFGSSPPPPPPPSGGVLSNGVAVSGLAAATGASLNYTLAVPAGASNLRFQISGGSGDADLYVRFGSAPTTTVYDCRPFLSGNSETCAITTAQAGTYHVLLRADAAFSGVSLTGSFSAGTADAAPTVTSTNPANNASGVARNANLSLSFSEPVTLGSWYSLSCTRSGTRTGTLSGGPSSYTLDPSTDFLDLDDCTWTILAAGVTDQDGTPTPMTSNAIVRFQTIGAASGYYASVNASSSTTLRSSLHAVIDDHTRFAYSSSTGTDTWDILERADQDPANAGRVLDIYKNASIVKAGGGNNFYNREHTWPKSLGFPNDVPSNYAYTDSHMLMLSDINYNSSRGNLPFGNCSASCSELTTLQTNGRGGGSGVFPGNSNWTNGQIFQVWNAFKGNVARALFYMDVRFEGGTHGVTGAAEPDLRLTDNLSLVTASNGNASVAYMGSLSVLLQWHQDDPVDANERLRNEVVASYQGNRNPFVDRPEWARCLFQNVCN